MNLLARKLAHLLAENSNNGYFEDDIRYGLEIAIGGLVQIAIIMGAALLLGIGQEVLAAIIAAALFRRYSGGAHCQAYYRCTITSLVTYIPLGYISRYIPASYLSIYITSIAVLSLLVIHYLVPVDNHANNFTNESRKKKLKIQSLMVLVWILAASIFVSYFMKQTLVALALLLGLFWQDFTLLPWGFRYINFWDQLFEKIEGIFKGEEVRRC